MRKSVPLALVILAGTAGIWEVNRRTSGSPPNGDSGGPQMAAKPTSVPVGTVQDVPALSKRGTVREPYHEDKEQLARAVETQTEIVEEKRRALAECVRRNGTIYQNDSARKDQTPRTLTAEEIRKIASLRSEHEARKNEFDTAQRDLEAMRKRLEGAK